MSVDRHPNIASIRWTLIYYLFIYLSAELIRILNLPFLFFPFPATTNTFVHDVNYPPLTMSKIRTKPKIAVLTSGGDSAGMNALVRAVVKYGIIRCATPFCTPIHNVFSVY